MINTYESFEELADAMCRGDGILHTLNCPGATGCLDWQAGVRTFAKWLDHIGAKVNVPDSAEDFYTFAARKQPARESTANEG